jgi:hypothetical protein
MDIIFFCLLKKIMEIFSGLPAELKSLIYNEYYRGGKRVGNKWIFPLDKERIEKFRELYNKYRQVNVSYDFWFDSVYIYIKNNKFKFYYVRYDYSQLVIEYEL